MVSLPSGTVTFFMSDIEGSTRLIGQLGGDFPRMLDEHFAVLGEAIENNGGTMVSSEGDSVFAVFPSARAAVAAAIEGQRAIAAHEWPTGATVRVRMGLHSGDAMFGGRDYTGIDVHRTARIMGAGHGGQILVSDAARALAGDDAAAGIAFRDLGVHALRDVPAPERLFGVMAPGLGTDFPPLRTIAPQTPTNLPTPLTRFVGRARELTEVRELLERERLVTLTGPGGTGKTRLAIEAARSVLDRYPDGVWFVALDVVREPSLVLPTIAGLLSVPEQSGKPIAQALAEFLSAKRALLVLDNFEQVVGAGPDVAALLQVAKALDILASSREPLAVEGEHVYPVPPLGLPAEPGIPKAADIEGQEAVILFVERGRAARANFTLSDANAPAVAAICRRLDGLPLALELAAARMNLLSPEQILARLDSRLTLLSSSRRDLSDRQRTLRGAIDWSHDMLTDPERRLFRGLSVFAGGVDLDAVEPVIDPERTIEGDVLDLTAALVDRSLVRSRSDGAQNRLEMLETIREYAAEQLADAPDAAAVARAHALYVRDLAEACQNVLTDPRRDALLDQLDLELANFRQAVSWSLRTGDLEVGLRLTVALRTFWLTHNHLTEARRALDQLLDASASDRATPLRTRALAAASELASWHTDYRRAFELAQAMFAMAEELGDPSLRMWSRVNVGWATVHHDPSAALPLFQEAIDLARPLRDDAALIGALQGHALALILLGDLGAGRRSIVEALERSEATGDLKAMNLITLGTVDVRLGDEGGGIRSFTAALRNAHEAGSHIALALAFDAIAHMGILHGAVSQSVHLASAAARLRTNLGGSPSLALGGWKEPLAEGRDLLSPVEFQAAELAGRALSLDEAVALAEDVAAAVLAGSA